MAAGAAADAPGRVHTVRQGQVDATVVCAQIVATMIAVYDPLNLMTPLGWEWARLVSGYALIWFLIENGVKLLAYRIFDLEQPALLRRDGTLAW